MKREWVVAIRDACKKAGVPFFFKQWGGTNKKQSGRLLDNRTWDEMPRKLGVEEELCLNFV
jgi:protein gp37